MQEIQLEFHDVSVEYLDSVILKTFYDQQMDSVCQNFLNEMGFIVQALKVGKMKFQFKSKNGTSIALTVPMVEQILNLGVDLSWHIENEYSLIIDSPKYLGFQLGQLKKSDQGMSFYRAAKVRNNKYIFRSISVFDPHKSLAFLKNLNRSFIQPKRRLAPYSQYIE